jgi:hypothetical protein
MGSYEDKKEEALGWQEAIEAFEHLRTIYTQEAETKALKTMRKVIREESSECNPHYLKGFTESLLKMEAVDLLKFTTPMPMPQPDFKAPSFCPSKEMLEVHFKMAQKEESH